LNFSAIPNHTLLGKLLRFPLRLIPDSTVLPILQGSLRGKKWIVGSGLHGHWLGSYEHEKQGAFREAVSPGTVVYDLGANAGYYSLLASVCVGQKGHVYSFEPLPRNVAYLRKHLELNRITNCTVIEAAVAARDGHMRFEATGEPFMGHLSNEGKLLVRTVRLDTLVSRHEILPPDVLKIDVEGAECEALEGAEETIRRHRPIIFLATHGASVHQSCLEFLNEMNYRAYSLTTDPVESAAELRANPEIVPAVERFADSRRAASLR